MILGVDPGTRRIGIACADEETRFARPVEVLELDAKDAIVRIAELVRELGATRVVVGRPVSLSGSDGPAAAATATFVDSLRAVLDVDVVEHDERLTTVIAERGMRAAGARRTARDSMRDAVAAQVMLQGYMDATR